MRIWESWQLAYFAGISTPTESFELKALEQVQRLVELVNELIATTELSK